MLTEIRAQYVTHKSITVLRGPHLKIFDFKAHYDDGNDGADQSLNGLLTQCPNLTSVTLACFTGVNDESIMPIVKACPTLVKLAIPDFTSITNSTSSCLATLAHLKELVFDEDDMTNEGIISLIKASPHLEVLRLAHPGDRSVLTSLGLYCPRLRMVSFCWAGFIFASDAGVEAMVRSCPLLEEIRFHPYNPSDQLLAVIAAYCYQLKRIGLGSHAAEYTDQGLVALSRGCPHLAELCLDKSNNNSPITDDTILSFAEHCHELESVKITNKNHITSSALCSLFQANPGITSIEIGCHRDQVGPSDAMISDEVLLTIAQYCTKLTSLTIGISTLTEAPLYAIITKCIWFEYISINDCNITDTFVDALVISCKRLKNIVLHNCHNITSRSLFYMLDQGRSLTKVAMLNCNLHTKDFLSRYYFPITNYNTTTPTGTSAKMRDVRLNRISVRVPWTPLEVDVY